MFDEYEKAKIEYLRYNAMRKRQKENKTTVRANKTSAKYHQQSASIKSGI